MGVSSRGNNKRIAKNTAFLYVRMLFSMVVSLYTSRVVLNTLGIDDYGIFNVVGGVVALFSFLNGAMASGTQRFLNFEIGTGNLNRLRNVFSTSLVIHIGISIVVLILAETVGLWFVNTKLVIPGDRLIAANWVYQFSVFSAMISLTQVPYLATIVANERMKVYGYVGIIESILRLLIVLMLVMFSFDKLKLYAMLTFGVSLSIAMIYRCYCKRKFPECKFVMAKDVALYREMTGFAGWNLFGNIAQICMNQGQNILLNIFFGPAVNAARAVAMSVNAAVMQFVNNLQMAVNPQIVKSYAAEDISYYESLIIKSAKFSFIILFVISAPILAETDYLLTIWLKNPPVDATTFCRLIIVNALITAMVGPLYPASQATGKIKIYQILVGGLLILNLPISYLFLHYGYGALSPFNIMIILSFISIFVRLLLLKKLVNSFNVGLFLKTVLGNGLLMSVITWLYVLFINYITDESLMQSLLLIVTIPIISLVLAYVLCLSKQEKGWIKGIVKERMIVYKSNINDNQA